MAKLAKQEGVFTIYNDKKELIAIVKRDDDTKEHLIYRTSKAVSSEIAELIADEVQKLASQDGV